MLFNLLEGKNIKTENEKYKHCKNQLLSKKSRFHDQGGKALGKSQFQFCSVVKSGIGNRTKRKKNKNRKKGDNQYK